jgi:hypothetical protein
LELSWFCAKKSAFEEPKPFSEARLQGRMRFGVTETTFKPF